MLINIPDNEVFVIISGLEFKHRMSKCTYCGDNMDGSPSYCSLTYMIKLLKRKYEELKAAQ